MSTLAGNICLFLAMLVSGILFSSVANYKPPLGGSGGADAFPIWMLVLHLILLCVLEVAIIVLNANGSFDWMPLHKYGRYLLLTICLIIIVLTSLMSTMMLKQTSAVPPWLGVILRYGYVVIPIVLISVGFVLNNAFLREIIPAALYKWPLIAVLGLSLLAVAYGVFEWLNPKSTKEVDEKYESGPEIKNMRLKEIESADIISEMVRIMEFTRLIYPPEVREKAVAKIKSHPSWQKELIMQLESDQARNALHFLSLEGVDRDKLFSEPVRKALMTVAGLIRHDIQGTNPSEFSKDMFLEDVHLAIRIVEKFDGLGIDYLPAMQEIREALDEPVGGEKIKFDCTAVLDQWLNDRL